MLDGLTYDDHEPPSIGIVPPDTTWAEVLDHIKIAHDFLLIQAGGEYQGAYWTGTEMTVLADLGPDIDAALDEFRDLLRQRGEL